MLSTLESVPHYGRGREIEWTVSPVADASALLQDLRHGAVNGCDGILGTLAHAGCLSTSAEAVSEVDARISRVAADPHQEDAMREIWSRYRVRLDVVEDGMVDLDVVAVADLAERDPTDLHLIAAANCKDAAVILSDDRDLRDLGLAPPCWLDGARAVATINSADATSYIAGAGLVLAVETVTATLRAARDGSATAMIAVLLAIGALAFVALDPHRRDLALEHAGAFIGQIGEAQEQRRDALASLATFLGAPGVDRGDTNRWESAEAAAGLAHTGRL